LPFIEQPLEDACFYNILKSKLNISNINSNLTGSNEIGLSKNSPFFRIVIEKILGANPPYHTLNYGMQQIEFGFATIVESKRQKSVQGLTKPLDSTIWALLFLWTLIFTLFVRYAPKEAATDFSIVFIIIDQGRKIRRRGHICLYLSWVVLALVLANCFKGKIFEISLNPLYPQTPSTVNEIEKFGYQTTSFSSYYYKHNKEKFSKVQRLITNLARDLRDLNDICAYKNLNTSLMWSDRYSFSVFLVAILKNFLSNLAEPNQGL